MLLRCETERTRRTGWVEEQGRAEGSDPEEEPRAGGQRRRTRQEEGLTVPRTERESWGEGTGQRGWGPEVLGGWRGS